LIHRYVINPLNELIRATIELSSGNLQHRAPLAETREFAALADHFNQMTERLSQTQSDLVRAEKLASIGRLAAGVAHEVGNPLSAVTTYLEVLRKRGVDAEVLNAIDREAARIDRIVQGLLAYARPRDEPAEQVDVVAVLRSAVGMLTDQGTFRGISVRIETQGPAPSVRARFHELEQVLVNLLLNAADAAPGGTIAAGAHEWSFALRDGATMRRSGSTRYDVGSRVTSARPSRTDLLVGTRGALIFVADSGPGVPAGDRERVFDPFYTTKAPGKGTGLGLAIVQRTVDQLGGVVWVEPAREGGAAFKMFIPT
jgi:signal transduction histidine kinase